MASAISMMAGAKTPMRPVVWMSAKYAPLIWVMMATTAVTIRPRVMCVYALLTELRSACSYE